MESCTCWGQNDHLLSLPLKFSRDDLQMKTFPNSGNEPVLSGSGRLEDSATNTYLRESLTSLGFDDTNILDLDPKKRYYEKVLQWLSQNKSINQKNELVMLWKLFLMTLSSFVEENERGSTFCFYEMNRSSADKIKTALTSCNDKKEYQMNLCSG